MNFTSLRLTQGPIVRGTWYRLGGRQHPALMKRGDVDQQVTATRRLTGAVELLVEGEQQLKSGAEIRSIAWNTEFEEKGALQRRCNDGQCNITYTPRVPVENALAAALAEGLLVYKFTIDGPPPANIALSPGTYYLYVQHLNGRWIGVAVDDSGRTRCATLGVVFKQVARIHPGRDHIDRPNLVAHKIASSEDLAQLGPDLPLAAAADWVEYQHDWRPFGAGCWSDIICIPAT